MYKASYSLQAERYGFNAGSGIYGYQPWNWEFSVHKKAIDAIKSAGGKLVRIDFAAEYTLNGTMVGEYDPVQKEYHRQLFEYLAQVDLHPIIVMNSGVPARAAYRKMLADATGDQTYYTDTNKFIAATNRRKTGIPEVFWPVMNKHMSEICALGAEIFTQAGRQWLGYAVVDIDNETAYVIDSEYQADPSIPYGTYPPRYAEMMEHRLNSNDGANFHQAVFIPGSYENLAGIDQELATGGGKWRMSAPWENVHLYIDWVQGDTSATFAARMVTALNTFLTKLDALNDPYRSKKPVAITEFNGIGIPQNLRKDVMVYTAKQLIKNSRVIFAIGYTMIENTWNGSGFSPTTWGVMDYATTRWGANGYVPYDYNTYPSSWTWASRTWDAVDNWGTTKTKHKECVQTVVPNLTVQFKKMQSGADLLWAESEAVGPELGYGIYTFTTATPLNKLGKNMIFSLMLYGDPKAGDANNPAGGAGEIQIANIGLNGEGTGLVAVFTGDGTNPVLAGSASYSGKIPDGKLTFTMEYRSTFIKWTWTDSTGAVIFTYTHTGFVPNPAVMKNRVRATLYSKRSEAVAVTKPVYVALSNFTYTP